MGALPEEEHPAAEELGGDPAVEEGLELVEELARVPWVRVGWVALAEHLHVPWAQVPLLRPLEATMPLWVGAALALWLHRLGADLLGARHASLHAGTLTHCTGAQTSSHLGRMGCVHLIVQNAMRG